MIDKNNAELKKKFLADLERRLEEAEQEREERQMDEKDWIIARLLYALYCEGRNANYPDAVKATGWFNGRFHHDKLLEAFSKISGENRSYEPYWKPKGTWE